MAHCIGPPYFNGLLLAIFFQGPAFGGTRSRYGSIHVMQRK